MLEIEYKGGNAVFITTKKTKIAVNPKLSEVGLDDIEINNIVELITNPDLVVKNTTPKLMLDSPGEYEVADLTIKGVKAKSYNESELDEYLSTIYKISIGDIRVALIGNIAPKLSEEQLEFLGVVDVVILPVGGGETLNAAQATAIVGQIEPVAVIPLHYADKALHYKSPQIELEDFVAELGAGVVEAGLKYKINSASALPDQLNIIKISRS